MPALTPQIDFLNRVKRGTICSNFIFHSQKHAPNKDGATVYMGETLAPQSWHHSAAGQPYRQSLVARTRKTTVGYLRLLAYSQNCNVPEVVMAYTDEDLDRLDALLQALPQDQFPMTLSELNGYVTGILVSKS